MDGVGTVIRFAGAGCPLGRPRIAAAQMTGAEIGVVRAIKEHRVDALFFPHNSHQLNPSAAQELPAAAKEARMYIGFGDAKGIYTVAGPEGIVWQGNDISRPAYNEIMEPSFFLEDLRVKICAGKSMVDSAPACVAEDVLDLGTDRLDLVINPTDNTSNESLGKVVAAAGRFLPQHGFILINTPEVEKKAGKSLYATYDDSGFLIQQDFLLPGENILMVDVLA